MNRLILIVLFCLPFGIRAQVQFHQNIFHGGVSAAGFSTGIGVSGNGSFKTYIEPGSTIKNAFLFTYRIGHPVPIPIKVNSKDYWFDTTAVLMKVNHMNSLASPVSLLMLDVTDSINMSITDSFYVEITNQANPINWGYFTVWLYLEYEKVGMSKVSSALWINNQDYMGYESYVCGDLNPIETVNPVCLSLFMDRACVASTDGSEVLVNSTSLGVIGGVDSVNSTWNCGGSKGHFYYQDSVLVGLDDDYANQSMDTTDALSDISALLGNGDTAYSLVLDHVLPSTAGKPNITPLWINSYTTPCDTFSTSITEDDTICQLDMKQLQATGGIQYSWYSLNGILDDTTIANPTIFPGGGSAYYMCTITNSLGCVKTEQVRIYVEDCVGINEAEKELDLNIYPNPSTGIINIDCAETIQAITIRSATGKEVFSQDLNSHYARLKPNLASGLYLITIRTQSHIITKKIIIRN